MQQVQQGSPSYGPWAKFGPRGHIIRPAKNEAVLSMMKKCNHENLLIWNNTTYPETITLRKMSSPRHVWINLCGPPKKTFGDPAIQCRRAL